MKNYIALLLIVFSFYACNQSEEQVKGQLKHDTLAQKKGGLIESSCYVYEQNGNSIRMEITNIIQDSIEGTLEVAYAEKDANQGTFKGVLKGDKLLATYTFNSEGIKSKREIAFLVQGEQLIEGYGELNDEGNAFKSADNIQYTSSMPLQKVDCD